MNHSFEKISESLCPSCGMDLDSALALDDKDVRKPDVGSIAICANCGIISVYSSENENGKLVLTEPSEELLKDLRADKKIWDYIIRIKAGIYASIISGKNPLNRGQERITNPVDFLTIDTQISPEDQMMHEITSRIDEGEDKFGTLTTEDIQERYANNPDCFCIVSMVKPYRVGTNIFTVSLEYNHFKPGTDKNKDFQFMFVKWQDMIYSIIVIPYKERDLAYKVAEETGMRISDGIPVSITGKGEEVFPIHSPRVFSLSNAKDSLIYTGSAEDIKKLGEEEDDKVNNIFQKHEKWLIANPAILEYK